jgi:hypothetical protein
MFSLKGAQSWCVTTIIQSFVWDACKDLTLIILMVAAAVSLALGIYTEVRITPLVLLFLLHPNWPSIISFMYEYFDYLAVHVVSLDIRTQPTLFICILN